MILCFNCGVELDDGLTKCPLCGKDPLNKNGLEEISDNYPSDILHLHKLENRKHLWELSGIIAFSGISVCTIIDLLVNKSLRWSLFTDVLISGVWIILTLILFLYRKTLIVGALLLVTIFTALFLTGLITGGTDWFIPVGLPLTIASFIVTALIIIIYRSARLKGLNIIAAALIVLSGFCIVVELTLDKFLKGYVDLRWSLIAGISILPVVLVLFHYHYRLKRGNRLDSFFHV